MKLDKYSITQSSKSIGSLTKEPSHYAESYGEEARQVYWRETDSAVASKMDLKAYAKSRMISFVSNDYLGLSQHPQVQSDAIRAINQFGTGFCAAPSIGGYSSFQKRLENVARDGYLTAEGSIKWENNSNEERLIKRLNSTVSCKTCRIQPLCNGGCSQNTLRCNYSDNCLFDMSEEQKDRIVLDRFAMHLRTQHLTKNL